MQYVIAILGLGVACGIWAYIQSRYRECGGSCIVCTGSHQCDSDDKHG